MIQISRRHCKECCTDTKHQTSKPNHVLHLILSVLTVGTWLVVWIILALAEQPPQCTECGKKYVSEFDKFVYMVVGIIALGVIFFFAML